MGFVWRIGSVVTAGTVAMALGLDAVISSILCFFALGILLRREIFESLFPLRAYQKNCLTIRGLEGDSAFEEKFRGELASAICKVFPGRKPTACCCIGTGRENCTATLVFHGPDGHFQIQVSAGSSNAAASLLLERVREYRGEPAFRISSSDLLPRCRGCTTRKVHRMISRRYPQLNTLYQTSRWGCFLDKIRTLTC